jgi:Uma2 family endonuclease
MNVLTENSHRIYTVEEYLHLEESASIKHHFVNGKMIAMPGATPTHNLIAGNMITQLNIELEKKPKNYFVLTSDSKLFIPRLRNFLYPDAVVVCEEVELFPGSTTVITNPLLIVEVLSPSTANHDRHEKFFDYKRIPSFKEYVLVEQEIPLVTTSFKTGERVWADTEADGLETSIYLQSIDCTIELKKIYRGLKF